VTNNGIQTSKSQPFELLDLMTCRSASHFTLEAFHTASSPYMTAGSDHEDLEVGAAGDLRRTLERYRRSVGKHKRETRPYIPGRRNALADFLLQLCGLAIGLIVKSRVHSIL
jgi:hypothetical protein